MSIISFMVPITQKTRTYIHVYSIYIYTQVAAWRLAHSQDPRPECTMLRKLLQQVCVDREFVDKGNGRDRKGKDLDNRIMNGKNTYRF